jgi:hypothetical protein
VASETELANVRRLVEVGMLRTVRQHKQLATDEGGSQKP